MDDSFYFSSPPRRSDIQDAIERNRVLAGDEWSNLYETFNKMLSEITDEELGSVKYSRLCGKGGPLTLGSWNINRYDVMENG
jgi:hypothetical protein